MRYSFTQHSMWHKYISSTVQLHGMIICQSAGRYMV